jgi:WD40 repeat protein
MRLNGKGRHGQHGGRAGDLVIHIKVGSPPPPPDEDAKVDFDLSAPKTGDAAFTLWRAMTGHVQPVTSVAFSPDGRVIASGSARKDKDLQIDEIRLWDAPTGTWILTIVGEGGRWRWWSPEISGGIHAVAFSPDGKTLACASADGTVKLWDAQTGALRRRVNHNGNVAVAFSPDGATIASASTDMTAKLWDAQTGVLKRTLSGHLAIVQSVAFSPDGTTLASGGIGASLILWDVATGQEKRMLTGFKAELKGLADGVPSVAFSPDGRLLASGCKSSPKKGGFVSWDAKMLTHEGPADVLLWDVESGKLLRTLHAEGVPSVAFSPPDGGLLACGVARKEGGEIRLWNPQTGTLRQTLAGQSGGVRSIAFSPDGKMIVSGTSNGVVEVWRTG